MARDLAAERQRRTGVGGREYLSGRHSNAVSINVPGHLLNQATAVKLDDIQLSTELEWTFGGANSIRAAKTSMKWEFGLKARCMGWLLSLVCSR